MRVRFTRAVQLESGGRNAGPVYEAGAVHELSDDQARRWLRRGVAEELPDAAPAAEPPAGPESGEGSAPPVAESATLAPAGAAEPKRRRKPEATA